MSSHFAMSNYASVTHFILHICPEPPKFFLSHDQIKIWKRPHSAIYFAPDSRCHHDIRYKSFDGITRMSYLETKHNQLIAIHPGPAPFISESNNRPEPAPAIQSKNSIWLLEMPHC